MLLFVVEKLESNSLQKRLSYKQENDNKE